MKRRKWFPNSALSAVVENLVGLNSVGRKGPFGMRCLRRRQWPAIAGHWRCLDCEPALAGNARNYFSQVGEYRCLSLVGRVISKCSHDPSVERKLVPAIPSIGSAPALEFPVKVGQLVDGIGAADLF